MKTQSQIEQLSNGRFFPRFWVLVIQKYGLANALVFLKPECRFGNLLNNNNKKNQDIIYKNKKVAVFFAD